MTSIGSHPIPPLEIRELATGGNRLLAALPSADLDWLARHARRERLARGHVLTAADEPAPAAFFIEHGVASVVKLGERARRTEICLLGHDDFTGPAIVMADGRWPYETFVQVDQLVAIRVEAPALRSLFAHSATARAALTGAVHLQMVQIAEGLASAAWQPISARLARWMLMYRDRVQSSRLEVTHEFMALMVGAQRTRITVALHDLENEGAIISARGLIIVRDAPLLEMLADGGYGVPEREAARRRER